ncbi:hypothetical protein STENM223S_00980 [Streptomyces tendae]
MGDRDDRNAVGRRVQRLRAERGLTQRQLAEPAYTPAYISTLEAGRVRPSDDALRHLAERLGVGYEELATGRPAHLATDLRLRLTEAQRTLATGGAPRRRPASTPGCSPRRRSTSWPRNGPPRCSGSGSAPWRRVN